MGIRKSGVIWGAAKNATTGAVLLLIVVFAAGPASADIYRYIDSRGVLHFTNAPTDPAFRLYMKEKGRPKPPPHYRFRSPGMTP